MRFLLLTVLLLCACATHKTPEDLAKHPEEAPPTKGVQKEPQASMEAKELGAVAQANTVVELKFETGAQALDAGQLRKLGKTLKSATGAIAKVEIVTWSDLEYPTKNSAKLPPAQVQLALQRGKFIERQVRALYPKAKLQKFNMAERPNAFSEWYSGTDANIKGSLEKSGLTDPKASRAIVLILNQ